VSPLAAQHRRALMPARHGGYAPLREYAAIGDGRTVALVARDGCIDWLCLPDLDSPSVLGALLDMKRGGRFVLAPEGPFQVSRRYLPGTNVLETTFETERGVVRVSDALALPGRGLGPARELQRRIEGLSGSVPMRWSLEPGFDYGRQRARVGRRAGVPMASAGADAIAVCSWEAGDPTCGAQAIGARFSADQGRRSLLVLSSAHQEPLVLPAREECERRLTATQSSWRRWVGERDYRGPWREPVLRSALALKLLVYAPSGAIAAAATASLPEEIGGERNWDYRFSWVRDAAFTLGAFVALGCPEEARAYFWWLMHASQLTHPRLQVLYRLDGGARAPEKIVPLRGYRNSAPVRVGNGAATQLQLDTYGELFHAAWLYFKAGGRIDADLGRRLAATADYVASIWRAKDLGIWEVRCAPAHFTQSKMMCCIALERAEALAELGVIPNRRAASWRREAAIIRQFVERRCWSEAKGSYVRVAGGEELDASLLLGLLLGYARGNDSRMRATVRAVQRELGAGPFVHRYSGDDGLPGSEGAFLACSFWLVEALTHTGRHEEATRLMDEVVDQANDVGLYSEEIDPSTGEFLGNFPQALSHLALIRAALAIADQRKGQ
jgi:GH15 family glucan-1,4-alpha-glucosidase